MTVQRTLTVTPAAAYTASFTTDALGGSVNEYDSVDIYLNVTAVSGTTPSMTATYQSSVDGGTTWNAGAAGSAITAAGLQVISVTSKLGSLGRISYAITGTTPSFTFSATAQLRRTGS